MNTPIQQVALLEKEIFDKKKELAKLRKDLPPSQIEKGYAFKGQNEEELKLADLFGGKSELLLVFNMGKSCPYCSLWADGLNGLTDHLESRAAFVVVSPDKPEVQKAFAQSRGWRFSMASYDGSDFAQDMGYQVEKDGKRYYLPGAMSFSKDSEGKIFRHANASFGPGDNYCTMWDFMDLLPKGANNWTPKDAQ